MMNKSFFIYLFLLLVASARCAPFPTVHHTVDTQTQIATPSRTLLPVLKSTHASPALAGTPMTIPAHAIEPGNARRIEEIARWNLAVSRESSDPGEPFKEVVYRLALSPDGKKLAYGSGLFTIVVWDISSGQQLYILNGPSWITGDLVFSPDGKMLAAGSEKIFPAFQMWEVESGTEMHALSDDFCCVTGLAYTPDGKTLAMIWRNTLVSLWDITSGMEIHRLNNEVYQGVIKFSPDGKILASGGGDGGITLYAFDTWQVLFTLSRYYHPVTCLGFSPDSKMLASGAWFENTIKIWDVSTGRMLFSLGGILDGHSDTVFNVAFSPDGRILASGSGDQTIKLWNVSTGEELQTLRGHMDDISGIAFSPDGKWLVSGSEDGTIRFWGVVPG